MDSTSRNIVTAPGTSEPQGSAVVGGSGVKAGSNVAGPLRSSSNDRESSGVARQAPDTLNTTSADGERSSLASKLAASQRLPTKIASEGNREKPGEVQDSVFLTVKALGNRMQLQDEILKALIEKAAAVECASEKLRSEQAKLAIYDLLSVVKTLRESRESVTKAFNAAAGAVKNRPEGLPTKVKPDKTTTADTGTDTPCWWEEAPPLHQQEPEAENRAKSRPPVKSRTLRKRQKTKHQQQQQQQQQQLQHQEQQQKQQQQLQQQQQQQQLQQQKQKQQQQKQKQQQQHQQPQQQQQQQQQQHQQQQQQQKQQQQPHQPQQPESLTWSQVVKRGRRKNPPHPQQRPQAPTRASPNAERVAILRRRIPRTAAVTIDRPAEGGSLAAVMKRVATRVNLATLGVTVRTTRKTRAGGILLEVEGAEKATLLAERIGEVVGESARVRLPNPKTPVLLLDVPEWAEVGDVVAGLELAGISGVDGGDSSISIRKNAGGRGDLVAWMALPYGDAIKLAEAKAVRVGWTRCRIRLLEKSLPTCFRCQQKGHVAAECRNEARGRRCHRCQAEDHLARECQKAAGGRGSGVAAVEEGPARVQPAVEGPAGPSGGRPGGRSASQSSSDPLS